MTKETQTLTLLSNGQVLLDNTPIGDFTDVHIEYYSGSNDIKTTKINLSLHENKKKDINEQRLKLIEDAKNYFKKHKDTLRTTVIKEFRSVRVYDYNIPKVSGYHFPSQSVWNKHIARAYGIARFLNVAEDIEKFGDKYSNPTEIIEGMNIELLKDNGEFHMSGEVVEYNKPQKLITLKNVFLDNYSKVTGEITVSEIRPHNLKIIDDTKAKY